MATSNAAAHRARVRPRRPGGRIAARLYAWGTLTPVLVFVALFTLFPFFYALVTSLHRYVLTIPGKPYVGLGNYRTALSDAMVHSSARTSLIFIAAAVPLVTVLGLGVAVLLNQRVKGFGILLVLVLLPWSVPTVSAGIMWRLLLHGDFGAIDGFLYRFHAIDSYVQWLSGSKLALMSVILVHAWREFPLPVILFLAGLQTIPPELTEAARLDRASAWQRFRWVTLPLLKAPLLIVLVYETIVAISVFDVVYVLTGGGPGSATTLYSWYTYTVTFKFLDLGMGAAMSFLMAAVLFVFILLYMRIVRLREAEA
ncbi:MAG TPA: sugar ABC transporter permease [Gaiellaceae bacterium]|jgi:ABC-type sugar transport system permease subunit